MQVTSPVMVGRDAELRQVTDALDAAAAGSGKALFVRGEPGIGKSRLVGESVSYAGSHGLAVLRGRSGPPGTLLPFRPLTEALFSRFRGAEPPADEALAPYLPVLGRLVPQWSTGAGGEPDSLVVLGESMLRLLAVTGRERGCLLVLEDLHDADAESLAVVEYLVDNLAEQPIVLLASLRPGTGPALELAREAERRRYAEIVELVPLPAPRVGELLAACLHVAADRLPGPLVDHVVSIGEGNPLVTEELLRSAMDAGALSYADGECRLVGPLGDALPDNVVHAVTRRADQLGPQVRALLDTAAVLGRRFDASLVQAILGLDQRALLNHLTVATGAQLLGPDGASPDRYAFRHAVTADALLASLMPMQVAAIARDAADVLTALHPKLPGEWCQLAGRLRAAAGDGPAAAAHYAEAGRRALADGGTESAIALFGEALAASATAVARDEVLESLVYALTEGGRLDRAFELAATLSPAGGDAQARDRRGAVHTGLAWGALIAARWDQANAQLAAARALIGPDSAPRLAVEADIVEAHLLVEGQTAAGFEDQAPDPTGAQNTDTARPKNADTARPQTFDAAGGQTADAAGARTTDTAGRQTADDTAVARTADADRGQKSNVAGPRTANTTGGQTSDTAGSQTSDAPGSRNTGAASVGSATTGGEGRAVRAERVVRRVVETAEEAGSPVAACQGWQLLALMARDRSFDEADRCLHRMLDVARRHELPIWRLHALLRLGINQAMRTGDVAGLEQARVAARGAGAIAIAYTAQSSLALEATLRGEYPYAEGLASACAEATGRLRYVDTHRYCLLLLAMGAAHQGRREAMDAVLSRFRAVGGEESLHVPIMLGLCRTFCALLEEDRDGAQDEQARLRRWESENPAFYYLAGRYGLGLLLDVLDGRADRDAYEAVAATPGAALRWNRQFLHLADAVLHGRAGSPDAAAEAFERASAASAPYPRAHHLGRRLVAEAAIADGWGTPVPWLRAAEEHFHAAEMPAVAGACRSLLRRAGARAPQRRDGRAEIPASLRDRGLTVREYEVLLLLRDRHPNKEIAERLFISPRTVEKHVASLLTKTGCADRAALREYARRGYRVA